MSDRPSRSSGSFFADGARLHSSFLLGGLQLLAWLFFYPSAWRNYLSLIEPGLGEDFSLLDLAASKRRNSRLARTLLQGFAIGPMCVGFLLGLALWLVGRPIQDILLVLSYAVVVSIAASLAGSLIFPAMVGMAASVVLGLASGAQEAVALSLSQKLSFSQPFSMASALPARLAFSSAIGLGAGIVGSLILHVPRREASHNVARQLGAGVVGAFIAVVMLGLAGGLGGAVSQIMVGRYLGVSASSLVFGLIAGLVVGGAVGMAVAWRTGRGIRYVMLGSVAGMLMATMRQFAASYESMNLAVNLGRELVAGLGVALFFTALFSVPYVIAQRAAGAWAGAIAGTLGSSGAYVAFAALANDYPLLPILPITLASSLIGMTLLSWQPFLVYPIESAWNLLLFRADARRGSSDVRPSLLRMNAAFWDERQHLPLLGLDDHLLLVLGRDPKDGKAAMDFVAAGRQRWAARATQIELDARQLERSAEVEDIARAHRSLGAGELEGPASALLRSFSRLSQDTEAALRQESAYNQRLALIAVEDRLDALLREVTRSSERYAIRFRPIASSWRQILAARALRLAEVAAHRQEIENPYVIGIPLTEQQEVFVGRADISATIEALVLDRGHASLLLYGQRRMGKTSLLNNLGRMLPTTILPLFVDLQGPVSVAKDDADLLYSLSRSIIASAQRQRALPLPQLTREALAVGPYSAFDEWLDRLENAMSAAGHSLALLSLDEFEALDFALEEGRISPHALLGMLRHMIQHRPCFRIMIAASHTQDELERWASFLVNVQTVHIGFLSEAEARQLIERPVKDFPLDYEAESCRRVIELTSGHPFLVQLICSTMVDLKNEQAPSTRRSVSPSDVEATIPRALTRGSFFFADIERNQVDPDGLAVLREMAVLATGSAVNPENLTALLAYPAEVERTITGLARRELIEPVPGGYRFRVEMIRHWFAKGGTRRDAANR